MSEAFYNITYAISGSSCDSTTLPTSSCDDSTGICSYIFDVSSSRCRFSSDIAVTIFGVNTLGSGATSTPIIIG